MERNKTQNKKQLIAAIIVLMAAIAFVVFESFNNAPFLYGGGGDAVDMGESGQMKPRQEYVLTGICGSESITGIALHFDSPGSGEIKAILQVEGQSCGEVVVYASDIRDDMLTKIVFPGGTDCSPDNSFKLSLVYEGATDEAPFIKTQDESITARYEVIWDSMSGTSVALLTATIVAVSGLIIFLAIMRGFKMPEQRFAVLYLVAGIGFFVALPLYRSPDEYAQFARIIEICRGQFISPEVTLAPEALALGNAGLASTTQRFIFNQANIDLGWNQLDKAFFPNTSYFFPTAFMPHVILMSIAHLITDRLIPLLYAARLGNFIGCGLVLWTAIKIIPYGKDIITAVSLFPMSLQGFISASADGFSYALFILFLALILRARNDKHKFTLGEMIVIYIVTLLFSLSKTAYTPLCLLLFLIPKQCFGKKSTYWTNVVLLGSLLIAINLVWVIHASSYPKLVPTVDTAAQISWILSNPVEYIFVLINTFIDKGISFLGQMIGLWLGWVNIGMPWYLMMIIGVAGIYIAVRDNHESFRAGESIFIILICAITLLATISAIYLQFNDTANSIVIGYQGRYLIPLIAPAIMAVKRTRRGYIDNVFALVIIGIADAVCASLVLIQTI